MQDSKLTSDLELAPHWREAQRFVGLARVAKQDASAASQSVERLAERHLALQTDEQSRLLEDCVKRAHANTALAVGFAAQTAVLARATRRATTADAAKAYASQTHVAFNGAELHAVRAEGDLAEARKTADKVNA